MQDALWEMLLFALTILAIAAPVAYFAFAGVMMHAVVGDNEKARHVMTWLFLVIWLMFIALLYAWF